MYADYYHSAFAHFAATISEQEIRSTPSPKRGAFWQLIPPGTFEPDAARNYLEAYLQSLEKAIQEKVTQHSLAYWLHLYRRIAPTAIGEDTDPITIGITRTVLDASIQKFAKVELCNRIAISNEVDSSTILRGFLTKNGFVRLLTFLTAKPQLVLTDFGPEEYREALQIEKLAYEIWRTMAQLRTVGKGAPLVVMNGGNWVADARSDDLDFLVSDVDRRERAFAASATGTVFYQENDAPGTIFLPSWNTTGESDSIRAIYQHIYKCRLITHPQHGTNFAWRKLNILAYYRAHEPFSQPFRERNGVSLESVIGVVAAMITGLLTRWMRDSTSFVRMWQRAYESPSTPGDIKQGIKHHLPAALEINQLPFGVSSVDVEQAFAFLLLTDEARSSIDVGYAGPHAMFVPSGPDHVFIDYAYLANRLNYLFYGVNLPDQNFKGTALEQLTHGNQSVLPTSELHARDGTSRQIDAAFDLGGILVICECRAKARSLAVEKGDAKALEVRRQLIERALSDIDEKSRWLSSHPLGRNYDVGDYQFILPVGVTPFVEFIHSRDIYFWIDSETPRVLSPIELRKRIDDGSLATAAQSSPNLVRLR